MQSLTDRDTPVTVCLKTASVTRQAFESKLSIRYNWQCQERDKETVWLLFAVKLKCRVYMLEVQRENCYETVGRNERCSCNIVVWCYMYVDESCVLACRHLVLQCEWSVGLDVAVVIIVITIVVVVIIIIIIIITTTIIRTWILQFYIRVDKKNQLDVTFCTLYFSTNSCSTCFGQPCAHHQELTTAWCYSLLLVCAVTICGVVLNVCDVLVVTSF